jgi:hypothetical protein
MNRCNHELYKHSTMDGHKSKNECCKCGHQWYDIVICNFYTTDCPVWCTHSFPHEHRFSCGLDVCAIPGALIGKDLRCVPIKHAPVTTLPKELFEI